MARARGRRHDGYLIRYSQLLGLCSLALAQPLFSVLANNSEFFSVRRSEPSDIVWLVVILALVAPSILLAIEAGLGIVSQRLSQLLHWVFVGTLAATAGLIPLHSSTAIPGLGAVSLAAVLGLASTILLIRYRLVRQYFAATALAVPIFAGMFLSNPSVSRILFPGPPPGTLDYSPHSSTSLLLLVFDALPVSSLLDANYEIDAQRYPNFARLAQDGLWLRNTTTVSDNTVQAVPAILTGRYPRRGEHPTAADHPENLFTLLGASHRLHAIESVTNLCPEDLCARNEQGLTRLRSLLQDVFVIYTHVVTPEDFQHRLNSIETRWNSFTDAAADDEPTSDSDFVTPFLEFVAGIGRDGSPQFFFHHTILPHAPHMYFPSGTAYARGRWEPSGQGSHWGAWNDDEWPVLQEYQRHLLQVGFVDTLLGRVLDRMTQAGIYDDTLIIVTADHGVSYHPGKSHRAISSENQNDILRVPLMIKPPRDLWSSMDKDIRPGHVEDSNVQLVDVVPTVASLMGIQLPWETDGIDLLAQNRSDPQTRICHTPKGPVAVAAPGNFAGPCQQVERKLRLFGSGDTSLFAWGPHGIVVGQGLHELSVLEPTDVRVEIVDVEDHRTVDSSTNFVPGGISGYIQLNQGAPERPWLAVAINGTIEAVTKPYQDSPVWSAVVREGAFRDGNNLTEVYLLGGTAPDYVLAPTTRVKTVSFLGLSLGARRILGMDERGFHATASWGGTPVRWTNGDAQIFVPLAKGEIPSSLQLDLAQSSSDRQNPTLLQLRFNGTELYDGPIPRGAWSRVFDLPRDAPGRWAKIEILSTTFVPSKVDAGARDDRVLGVALEGIVLR